MKKEKIRLIVIIMISLFVIVTGSLFAAQAFRNNDLTGGILGIIISLTILGFAVKVFLSGSKNLKEGYPVQDERSRKVLQKASSTAFYLSLYILLAIGFLSEEMIDFRDVSQATSIAIGLMTLLFAIFWAYYNRKKL